jgi:hypothetical protein
MTGAPGRTARRLRWEFEEVVVDDVLVVRRADPGHHHGVEQQATAPAAAAVSWTQPNANLAGTRDVQSSVNLSNVSRLGVAWTVPLTGKAGMFGNFATRPVTVGGVVYIQDLDRASTRSKRLIGPGERVEGLETGQHPGAQSGSRVRVSERRGHARQAAGGGEGVTERQARERGITTDTMVPIWR